MNPWIFFGASVCGALFTLNALRPLRNLWPRIGLGFFPAWFTSELATHHLLLQVSDAGGTLWLTRPFGLGRGLEIMLTGREVEAPEALTLRLANRADAPGELSEAAGNFARELAKGPSLTMAAIKRSARGALEGCLEDALGAEREGPLTFLRSADFMEDVQAWMQKRQPRFEGK